MTQRGLKNQLITLLKSHCSESIKFAGDEINCEPCRVAAGSSLSSFPLADHNLYHKLLKHLSSENHKTECGWSVERNFDTRSSPAPQLFKLVRRSVVNRKQCTLNIPVRSKCGQQVNEVDVSNPPAVINLGAPCTSTQTDPPQNSANSTQTDQECVDTGTNCDILPPDFEGNLRTFLKQNLHLTLRDDFSSGDLADCYRDNEGLKTFTENALHRKGNARSPHNTKARDFAVHAALSHSTASASHWSKNFGGPSHRTIRQECTKRMQIPPFIDRTILEIHMLLCLSNAAKDLNMDVEDMIKVPFIAAQDATAVSGRVNTFKDKIYNSDNFLYGIMPRNPFQELRIKAVWEEGATDFVETDSLLLVNGLEVCGKLLEEGKLERATTNMAIVLLPLTEKPKPYVIGVYGQGRGSGNAENLAMVHRELQTIAKKIGM